MLTLLAKILNPADKEYTPSKASQKDEQVYKALIGDIGGTNIRLRLISFTKTSRVPKVIKASENMKSASFNSFADSISHFLKNVADNDWPQIAGVGMAGAVLNNENLVTNAPHWPKIIGNDLAKQFKMKQFQLFNDFEVASYACLNLNSEDVVQINSAVPIPNKIINVCGAGTGLGVASIVPHQKSPGSSEYVYNVWPGEGGHVQFSPANDLQYEFLQFLLKHYPERTQIALEYAFVGPAIPYMYFFFKNRYPNANLVLEAAVNDQDSFNFELYQQRKSSKDEKEREKAQFPSHLVFEYGVDEKDQICMEIIKLFMSIYETAIGDIAIRNLSFSGIYLVGSMSIAVLPYILRNKSTFMKEYKDNRPYLKDVLERIPVYVIKEKDIGLDGAFVVTKQMIE